MALPMGLAVRCSPSWYTTATANCSPDRSPTTSWRRRRIPRIRLVHMETRPGTNPLGVRGIGEGGVIPAAATIANALARAIDPKKSGHEVPLFTLPLGPERVFAACQALSASPFRQRDATGDADRKSKHGCAHC